MSRFSFLFYMHLACAAFGQVPTDSLFFHAPFNGDFDDVVGKMTGNNSGSLLVEDRFLLDSSSLYVDGVNDLVDYGTGLKMRHIDSFTASFWIKPIEINYSRSGGPKSGRYAIFGNAGSGYGFRFFQYQDELHFTVASVAGTDYCYYELDNSERHSWLHLVGVSNNGYLSLYVNGKHIRTAQCTNSTRYLGRLNLEMGRGTLNNRVYWEGRMDEIRMYNTILSPSEIKNLYDAEIYKVCGMTKQDTINVFDTNSVVVFDTTTVFNQINDTILVTDTVNITNYDTALYLINIYDTVTVVDTATYYIYDSIRVVEFDTNTVMVYDTIMVYTYDTLPLKVTLYDTTFVEDTLNIYYATSITAQSIKSFKLYPNPTHGMLNIERSNSSGSENASIVITNTLGKVVWQEKATKQVTTINLSELTAKGLYHLIVIDTESRVLEKRPFVVY